jgi:uncharacterized protein YdeI (YjbR/CyaY-like superfamily)
MERDRHGFDPRLLPLRGRHTPSLGPEAPVNRESVDSYLQDGCGRCDHYRTPQCKVLLWTSALVALRKIVLEAGLVEEMKWGSPCYTLGGKNVLMIVSFRESCAMSFFKGASLEDPSGLLESAGPNAQHGRLIRFQGVERVEAHRAAIAALVAGAIAVERSGKKLPKAQLPESLPEELEARLAADPELRRAFEALTPGRKRSHVLHVSGAQQTETRARRAERCAADILAGKGFNERG